MSTTRTRSERLEVRTTKDERALIDRAVAARRVLADRSEFVLDAEAAEAWEAVNRRAPRELPGLRRLSERPSPFTTE